ncbi:16 kDa calcium-binding protein [Taenia solium]|eukprot:TsM_001000000 transcript=TsM_001000000 gene=TsM_001000000
MTNLFAGGDFMRKQFSELDRDGDGFITEADLKACIKGHPFHTCAVNRYDQNGDKKISFEEYRNGLLAYLFQNLQNEDMARSLFSFLDADKSGAVSVKELYNFFEGCIGTLPRKYVEGFLEGLDSNKDGEISESEFLAFVKENRSRACSLCSISHSQFMPPDMR